MNMAELLPDVNTTSRKNERAILQAIASIGLKPIADATGVDESTVTRWKEKDIPRFCKMLATLGIKCVPAVMQCYEPKQIGAILELAKARLAQIEHPSELQWDSEE